MGARQLIPTTRIAYTGISWLAMTKLWDLKLLQELIESINEDPKMEPGQADARPAVFTDL